MTDLGVILESESVNVGFCEADGGGVDLCRVVKEEEGEWEEGMEGSWRTHVVLCAFSSSILS